MHICLAHPPRSNIPQPWIQVSASISHSEYSFWVRKSHITLYQPFFSRPWLHNTSYEWPQCIYWALFVWLLVNLSMALINAFRCNLKLFGGKSHYYHIVLSYCYSHWAMPEIQKPTRFFVLRHWVRAIVFKRNRCDGPWTSLLLEVKSFFIVELRNNIS